MEQTRPAFVPNALRRRFVTSSATAWLILASVCALISGLHRKTEFSYVVAVPVAIMVLVVMRGAEIRVRRLHLPREGQRPWCFRLTLMLLVVSGWMGYMENRYRFCIPGLCQHIMTTEQDYRWIAADGSTGEIRDIGCVETRDVVRTLTRYGTFSQSNPRLRFYSQKHPEASGWVVRSPQGPMVRESDGTTLPWDGNGLLQVMEEFSGLPSAPGTRPHLLLIADTACSAWSRGESFDFANRDITMIGGRGTGYRFTEISGSAFGRAVDRPWWGTLFFGSIWAMIATGIHFTAKATMGAGRR